MKNLPFVIKKFMLSQPQSGEGSVDLVDDVTTGRGSADGTPIPGYFVMSSATPNIDGDTGSDIDVPSPEEAAKIAQQQQFELDNAAQGIKQIAQYLYSIHNQHKAPELVITVHGYNTSRTSVQNWYKDIFYYINRHDKAIADRRTQVFIGYRWPSENVEVGRFLESIKALPPLPRDILIGGGAAALGLLLVEALEILAWSRPGFMENLGLWQIISNWLADVNLLQAILLALATGLLLLLPLLVSFMMVALVVMRLVVYFRDRYRANNFGVLDLVELLRQIDWALVKLKAEDIKQQNPGYSDGLAQDQALKAWRQTEHRVKLSFIGHSMGGFVVTNAVRILSDVFDSRSIEQQPPADVGSVFRLERLLLASPDIPILSIISTRTNFLASSLRRFAESYLLSSEGDIALRIASTAANYIAFPSRTQSQGYRLGNVALHGDAYGVVNLNDLDNSLIEGVPLQQAVLSSSSKILDSLFVTAERFKRNEYVLLSKLFRTQSGQGNDRITVADFFTFFDCTDYVDKEFSVRAMGEPQPVKGILTRAKRKKALWAWDYFLLTYDYITGARDVHGGYFRGEFTQALLYRTAFLGFTGYLQTLDTDPNNAYDPHVALSKLHMACRDKGIQGFLSPIRYRVDIQKQSLTDAMKELLQAISQPLEEKVEEKVEAAASRSTDEGASPLEETYKS
ncbi:MAG: alpha/beta hydrolase [Cyanobacteria bacterium P01_A01_bin.135]